MGYYGSWKIDDLLTFAVNTHSATTGAATDADSVPTYRVYEDETGTAILNGSMAKLDDANTTGFYSEQITLSAANGFEKGKCYTIYISAAVSSVTGTTHHNFQIEAEVDANAVSVTGSGLTAIPWNASWDAEVQSEVQDALDATIADSVPADGSRPSVVQALLMITRFLMEKSVSGTTLTVKKEDGSTSSMTFTLDSGTAPTSITRAT